MPKYQFANFTLKNKVDALKRDGSNIATRQLDAHYVWLYTWRGIYIEVWSLSHIPWQDVVKVKMLDNFKLLRPYLPHMFFSQQYRKTK